MEARDFSHEQDIETKLSVPPTVRADQTGAEIDEVYSGYFSSQEAAESYIEHGIKPLLPYLPDELVVSDWGGGKGYLASKTIEYLVSEGKKIKKALIIDANEANLEAAKSTYGFETLRANLEDVHVTGFDLVLMRAVLQYNSLRAQQTILFRVREAVTSNGFFVNQISIGDQHNAELRREINHLQSLGRSNNYGSPYYITAGGYKDLCRRAHLTVKYAGDAPANGYTLVELFDRFHRITPRTSEDERKKIDQQKVLFLEQSNDLIRQYKPFTRRSIQGVGENQKILWTYRIYNSQIKKPSPIPHEGRRRLPN